MNKVMRKEFDRLCRKHFARVIKNENVCDCESGAYHVSGGCLECGSKIRGTWLAANLAAEEMVRDYGNNWDSSDKNAA